MEEIFWNKNIAFIKIGVGLNCSHPISKTGVYNGMVDCSDSECCSHPGCSDHIMCISSNDPVEVLLRKQPPSVTASFYQRVKFLIEENSVQSYAHMDEYTERAKTRTQQKAWGASFKRDICFIKIWICMHSECSNMCNQGSRNWARQLLDALLINDIHGMVDCSDSECCSHPGCSDHIMCISSNDPVEVLLRKQPPSVTASFYQRVKFLIEENSVQSYAHMDEYTERYPIPLHNDLYRLVFTLLVLHEKMLRIASKLTRMIAVLQNKCSALKKNDIFVKKRQQVYTNSRTNIEIHSSIRSKDAKLELNYMGMPPQHSRSCKDAKDTERFASGIDVILDDLEMLKRNSRVSVMRGQVVSPQGLGIVGIRVSVDRESKFDVLVNGGGAVTLQFQRSPFKPKTITLYVPWNQIIVLPPIHMQLTEDGTSQHLIDRNPALYFPGVSRSFFDSDGSLPNVCEEHDPEKLRPIITGTWMPEAVGGMQGRSVIFAETQIVQESIPIPDRTINDKYVERLIKKFEGSGPVIIRFWDT
ncbi:hypothetical protein HUJ04_001366 [Dendroctonus ponderosae]|nr:hypothetical protein HUJ04_001366 [Dendroctonus ponderosae]